MTKPAEVYACLYAREFPAQALLRLRPDLRDKPCVVMDGEPPLQEVCSLTRKARSLGLAHGMTQVEVDTFSEVTVLERSSKEETAASEALLECAGCFSPRVEAMNEDRFFLCVLDIAGTKGLFGPPDALTRNLLTRVSALGITACAAVSGNFHAAVAVAKAPLPLSARVVPAGRKAQHWRRCLSPCWISANSRPRRFRYGAFARWVCWPHYLNGNSSPAWGNPASACAS